MSEFILTESFIGGTSIEIDQARFDALLISNKIIRNIWDIEEIFSLLANSFVELEEYMLSAGIRFHYQRENERNADYFFDDVRQNINLKLVATLTASRVYEEQLHRRISRLSVLLDQTIDMRPSFATAFDESLEYRVMSALRNHALHNQLPLSMMSFGGSNLSETGDLRDEAPSRHRVTVDPKIVAQEIIESDKLRKATKQEVEELGYKYLDLKFFMRGFIAGLARCHESSRNATQPFLDEALACLRKTHDDLRDVKGGEPKHVSIVKLNGGRKEEDHFIDFVNKSRIIEIRNTWTGLKWVQRSYLSSEIKKSKDTYPEEHPEIWIAK